MSLPQRQVGQVKFFNADNNYGFIQPLDGTSDVFVHVSEIVPRYVHNTYRRRDLENHAKLYSGEYVMYTLQPPNHPGENLTAAFVTGLHDTRGQPGPLMCDFGQVTFESYSRHQFPPPAPEPAPSPTECRSPDDDTDSAACEPSQ